MGAGLRTVGSDEALRERLTKLVNYELEQALIGGLLADNRMLTRVGDMIAPALFADPLHGRIYEAIRDRIDRGETANFLTLRAAFEDDAALVRAGGARYLARLENAVVATFQLADYAEILRDLWRRRELLLAAHEAGEIATDPARPFEDAWGRLIGEEDLASVGFEVKAMNDVVAKPEPKLEFLVAARIPMGTTTLLSAKGGSGKSYLMLQLMTAMATGTKWLGLDVLQGSSYALFCEDPEDVIHIRQRRICERLALPLDLPGLSFTDRTGEACELFGPMAHDPWRCEPTALWHRFAAKMAQLKPRLIVIDTAADTFDANENDRSKVRRYVRMLNGLALRLKAAVILCSHPSVAGEGSGSGISGSTGWLASVRAHGYLRPCEADDPELLGLAFQKGNLSGKSDEVRLRYDAGAFMSVAAATGEVARIQRKLLERLIVAAVRAREAQEDQELYSAQPRSEHRYLPGVIRRLHPDHVTRDIVDCMKDLLARGTLRETPRSKQRRAGLIVDPQHKPDEPDGGPAGGGS